MPATAASTKLVAITFDDGPSGYTETLLDGLKARNAKATFFIVGSMAASRMSTVKRAVKEGHQIGNHTTNHPELTSLSADGIRRELDNCSYYLKQAAGEQDFLLRPPYGSYNSTVRNTANMPLILWSVDTLDWKYRNADTVYKNIINNTTDGSIVLLHDLYYSSVQGVLRAIDTLKARGYEFVTVNELFRRRAVPLEKGKAYSAAYNKGITLPAVSAPEISVKNVNGGKEVSIQCDADIYYTTDGSTPTRNSKKYTGKFTLTETADIRAVGFTGTEYSDITQKTVWVELTPLPASSYADGYITLKAPAGATLYYTTDGSAPTYKSAKYVKPVKVKNTLNVLAVTPGKADRTLNCTVTKYGKLLIDVKYNAWYIDIISEAMNSGIMNGVGEKEFDPDGSVTRAMFVTVLSRLAPPTESVDELPTFTDVKKDVWYTAPIAWAQADGIVKGVSETEFMPDAPVTREQMCSMLNRFFTVYGYALEKSERKPFTDIKDVSDWAVDDVNALYYAGIINGMGDDTFCPKQTATRAQCAKIAIDTKKFMDMPKPAPEQPPEQTPEQTPEQPSEQTPKQ